FSDCTLSGVVVTLKDEAEEKYRRIASDFNQHVVITSRVNEVKRKYTMATSQESVHVHMVVSDPSVIRCVTKSEAATYTHNARPSESVDYAGYGSEPRPPPDLPPPQDFIFTTNTIAPAVAEYLPVQTVPPPPVVESVPRPSNVPPRPHTWSNRVLARVARLICWAFGLGRRP
ncbi:MAG: hypothetical protein NTV94_04175, partial [Planctomycetota bacterium]|nr:hypothetical protein [Planctomycetota bacterium]